MKENMQNGTRSELYTNDKKSSSNANGILKSARSFMQKRQIY